MLLEYAESIVQLLAVLVAMLTSLFQYINHRRRYWLYALIFFLCFFLSSYSWTTYMVIMGESPGISDLLTYFGWNLSFVFLLILVLHVKSPEERRYIHPLMFLPIPLNFWQLTLYLPYGGEVNSIYQVTIVTAIACMSLQSICWYRRERQNGAPRPYVAMTALLFSALEFGMWTSTCLDQPVAGLYNLYYLFSFLASGSFLLLNWALSQRKKREGIQTNTLQDISVQQTLKLIYLSVVVACCLGGILLGVWMRNLLSAGIQGTPTESPFNIISVMLFLISLFLAAFALSIVLTINFRQKTVREIDPTGEESPSAASQVQEQTVNPAVGKPSHRRISLLIPMAIIFVLMVFMMIYTTRVIQNVSVANIRDVGEDRIDSVTAQMENYLNNTKSVLWVTADTVDHMSQNGTDAQEILRYITEESTNQESHFDENYSGIYGYVMGEYMDGDGWVPPEGYEPQERDWYKAAVAAGGEATIVPPYVDAQTGAVIISISRMLSNGTDVLSLDVTMNHIQDIVSELHIKGKGYGFVVNHDGMIIAHHDEALKGTYMSETDSGQLLMEKILEAGNGSFEIEIDSGKSTAFVHRILDQWYIVILVSNQELYQDVWHQLAVNILISMVIFSLITFFYYLGYKNEQNYSHCIEEMRAEEQKQAYEARALRLEKEAADHANKAKSDFLAEMSHEIRTPINAVLGMNEMVLRESSRAKRLIKSGGEDIGAAFSNIDTYAGNIERAGKNLLSIINDILDFSKIEAGKTDIIEAPYTLSSVLRDVNNLISFKAKEKGLVFSVSVDETIPDGLCGDEARVRQVMTNILNNAVKYTRSGSVSMDISMVESDELVIGGMVNLIITVRDTGIGIKPEDIAKLFTKFQRVDLNANSTVEGTGLGLAITRSLLTMMNGSIRVESEYGKGSAFTVSLPQRIVSLAAIGNIHARFEERVSSVDTRDETFHAPDAHILIVDDTPMNLTVAIGLLRNTGIQIDSAVSGEEALALTQSQAYDLILMDQRMPRMDGTEAMRLIREQTGGHNSHTPVICVTADAVIGARERYLEQGFTDYLTKPINSSELEKLLIRYLPPEKVIIITEEAGDTAEEDPVRDSHDWLKAAGVAPDEGLSYCEGNPELYDAILREYLKAAGERQKQMQRCIDEGNWKDYGTLVHALKSTSRMIGARGVSETAAALEAASDQGDSGTILRMHPGMMTQYRALSEALASHIDTVDDGGSDDDKVLEFMPE